MFLAQRTIGEHECIWLKEYLYTFNLQNSLDDFYDDDNEDGYLILKDNL